MTTTPPAAGEIRQLLVHPAVWTRLEAWLGAQGIELANISSALEDDLPTYVMTPRALLGVPAPQEGPVAPSAPRSTPDGAEDAASPERATRGRTAAPGRCDGCGHIEHPPRQCPLTEYGQRCACDEPITAQRHRCAHCGREVENRYTPHMGGPGRDHWVHVPGSYEPCHPQRGADSPRAEPSTAPA